MLNSKYDAKISAGGAVGDGTVDALNKVENQEQLLQEIANLRRQYYTDITVRDKSQIEYLKDWLNRVDDCLLVKG